MGKYNWNAQSTQEAVGGDISKINAAQLVNMRIQNSWLACRRMWNDGKFKDLNNELNFLWTEFYADASKQELEKMDNLNKEISKYTTAMLNEKDKRKLMRHNQFLNHTVMQKWLFLKTCEKKQGVGRAYVDKDEDDFE